MSVARSRDNDNSTPPEINFYGGVRRACDACRKKKQRCDSQQPCGVCRKTATACLYHYVPKKKGPKGSRAKPLRSESSTSTTTPISVPQFAGHQYAPQTQSQSQSPSGYEPYRPSPTSSASPNQLMSPGLDRPLNGFNFPPHMQTFTSDPGVSPASFTSHNSKEHVEPSIQHKHIDLGTHRPEFLHHDSYEPPRSQPEYMSAFPSDVSSEFGTQLPRNALRPFVELFFQHLFPIMPVLDRDHYTPELMSRPEPLFREEYCLLTALCAVTIVQLNLQSAFIEQVLPNMSAQLLVDECFRARGHYDFIEHPRTSTVLTSFFLFCYYGHLEKHSVALHFLHEAISFAECIDLDDEAFLSTLEFKEGQWRRRIFWLIFVTERAYALQRQNRVKMQDPTVSLPAIFESEEPRLLYGFCNLVNLFLAVDGTFLAAWNGQKSALPSREWLMDVQRKLDASANAMTMIADRSETQQLDIDVSRQWLHALAWQISVKHGMLSLESGEERFDLSYPIRIAGDLVTATSTATQVSLDSHGIGMEQKIADIAGCLTDVLKCADGDASEPFRQGREYLMALIQQLTKMRGVQSRYLEPLLVRSGSLIDQLYSPMSIFPRNSFGPHQAFHGGVVGEEEEEEGEDQIEGIKWDL